jgi:hypothetical protein
MGLEGEAEVGGARRAEDVTDQACREGCGALRSRGKQIHARERWKGAPDMRLKLICAVLVGVLLVVAPGCGSKKKSESTKAATTQAATTTEKATTTSSGGLSLNSKDCQNLAAASKTLSNAVSGKVPNDMNTQVARLQALAKVAPAEIKGDFQVLAEAGAKFASLHIQAGHSMTPAQLAKLLSQIDVTKLSAASQHITTWAQKNCTAG